MHNFFARVNLGPASAPASFGAPDLVACVRVKHAKVFFAFMLEMAILSAFLASRISKRTNSQNCRAIARRAMPANATDGG